MSDFQSELIGFGIVSLVVIILAYFTGKMEKKYKDEAKKD